jgi:transcriptional regulator with XRE-family HTH domain
MVWVSAMKLVDYRKKRGLTQKQLGELLDLEQPTVARYEAGKRLPQRDELDRIYKLTDGEVTANDFVDHEPVPGEAA